ncbi:MAG: hypothetical protein DMF84_23500 [Acidobacteria bacterium]|nr:MAG: hypothetical protein DMF84_23500 [Acidobacteriota bacterium]
MLLGLILWLPIGLVACGKKGPPLAPLNLVPEPAANLTARRLGSTVYLQMSVPSKNANGPGPVAVDHLEIYAVTAAAGAAAPGNRELLTSARLIGRVPVKPPVREDEPPLPDNEPKDTRPAPGETVTFTETLTEAQLTPQIFPAPKPAGAATAPSSTAGAATGTPPAATPADETATTPTTPPAIAAVPAAGGTSVGGAATPPPSTAPASTVPSSTKPPSTQPTSAPPVSPASPGAATPPPVVREPPPAPAIVVPTRIYVVRGITRRGRPGSPSVRMTVPLIPPPPIATALATSFTETAVTITWLPPVVEIASAPTPISYNVYAASSPPDSSGEAPKPLNEKPLDVSSFEHVSAKPGVEQCFVVRTVETLASTMVESEPSARTCITPRDTFPPAAPKALSAVAGPGAINLIWDANTEADLAGYVVLRGEAPGDTLQPLNGEPTRETRYRDATVTPGVHYVYAIVAIDRAGNRSAASPRVEETAR